MGGRFFEGARTPPPMDRSHRVLVTAAIGLLGALGYLGLTVYPFDYGPVESLLLAGAFVALAAFEFVLDEASF